MEISINELVSVFRDCIESLIPHIEKLKINWKSSDSYDDWDNIEEVLYKNIVCANLAGEVQQEYKIPRYGFSYSDYSNFDYIKVESSELPDKKTALVSFESERNVYDKIRIAVLDEKDMLESILSIQNKDVDFIYCQIVNMKRVSCNSIQVVL